MVDIFDEVSGDLRSERAVRLLRRYGALAVAAALAVVLAVAAQQAWQWHLARRDAAAAIRFLQIGEQMDAAGATPNGAEQLSTAAQYVDFANTAPAGYQALARLRAAGLYADAGALDTAAGLWTTVGTDNGIDPMLRDLANLLWAQHELGVAPDDDVAARLAPLVVPQNPYHGLAQETEALLFLRQGKTDQAKALFGQIANDAGAPDGVRNRADGLLAKLNG